jgi:exodeoxyribonuclease VII large subunit
LAPAPNPAWSVSELVLRLRKLLAGAPDLRCLQVRGEISDLVRSARGHLYFCLKDRHTQIACVMFAGEARRLDFQPGNGAQVTVTASVEVYEPRGQVQLQVWDMQPDGLGRLYALLEKTRRKLAEQGLFRQERKRPLPRYPRCVGVVTSPSGAVLHDICTTLKRRNPSVRVLVAPAPVQGDQAPYGLVAALRRLARQEGVDCIIVARGGGSLEDLMAFNTEMVVRAVAACPVPVISAVGHETDVTLCDLAADVRAPTPTAAAEMAAPSREELHQTLTHLRRRLLSALDRAHQARRLELERLAGSPCLRQPGRLVWARAQQADDLERRLLRAMQARLRQESHLLARLAAAPPLLVVQRARARLEELHLRLRQALPALVRERAGQSQALGQRLALLCPARRLAPERQLLAALQGRARRAFEGRLRAEKEEALRLGNLLARGARQRAASHRAELSGLGGRLDALSPLRVLDRGYALARDPQGRLITSTAGVRPGDRVDLRLRDGTLGCRVETVRPEDL